MRAVNEEPAVRFDVLFVWTARYLVVAYLAFVVLDGLDVLSVLSTVQRQLLFWATICVGLSAAVVLYRPHVGAAVAAVDGYLERLGTPGYGRLLSDATATLSVALLAAVVLSTFGVEVDEDAVGWLYGLLVGVLSVTLAVRDDRRATLATRAGAAAFVAGLVVGAFVGPLPHRIGVTGASLGTVLVGLTVWKGRDRLDGGVPDPVRAAGRRYEVAALVGLTVVAAVLYLHRLGFQHLNGDEHQVVAAAAGFYHTGEFHLWNWITSSPRPVVYDRAWPHTLLVAASYAAFGISEWSSRLPSALAGVVTVPVSYVVFRYFAERRDVALVASAALVCSPVFVHFFRWTRMYAILVPTFLLLVYLGHRVLTEEHDLDLRSDAANAFVERHANVNVRLGLLALPVLLLGVFVHRNTLFLLPAVYLFASYQYVATRERTYLVAAGLGTVGLAGAALLAGFTDRLAFVSRFVSPFARENDVYVAYVFGNPLPTTLGVVLVVAGLVGLRLADDRRTRSKLAYLYILTAFSLVFLVFVGDRYASYAYVVHVVPVGILLVLVAFRTYVASYHTAAVRYALVVLLLAGVVWPMYGGAFGYDYRTLYHEDTEDFTTAYGTIVEHHEPGEAILLQYPRRYYLQGLDDDAAIVDMESDQAYRPDEFYRDVAVHGSGWVAWETEKRQHVHPEIRAYVAEHFEKRHGRGVDGTDVEVYSFDEDMLVGIGDDRPAESTAPATGAAGRCDARQPEPVESPATRGGCVGPTPT